MASPKKRTATAKPKTKAKKVLYGPAKPKRPQSAYMLFAGDFRKSHTDLSMLDQARQAGEEWNKLSADSKKPYEEQHLKLKESYTEKKKIMIKKRNQNVH